MGMTAISFFFERLQAEPVRSRQPARTAITIVRPK
jgi:hypothetical protein